MKYSLKPPVPFRRFFYGSIRRYFHDPGRKWTRITPKWGSFSTKYQFPQKVVTTERDANLPGFFNTFASMNQQEPDEDTLNRWHQDPENWRWGFIYFNPRDKRILVLKRMKWAGITLNFAHPQSHAILFSILALIILLARFGG